MTDTTIISTQILFYDTYEYEFGDGFYPTIEKDVLTNKQISINFLYDKTKNQWIQINEIVISGLDGDNGINLLNLMNKKNNVNCVAIYNSCKQILYPKK